MPKKTKLDKLSDKVALLETMEANPPCDFEKMHSIEDEIHVDALKIIRKGCPMPETVARLALRTTKLAFPRWYG